MTRAAVLGTGLSRPPEGPVAKAIARIASARKQGARVVAVDLPSGLDADTAGFYRNHLVVTGHVEHDPALEGHGLAVISGPAAAKGQRDPALGGRCRHQCDFFLAAGLNEDVRSAILQLRRQHRAIPVEVARLQPQLSFIRRGDDVADILPELLNESPSYHLPSLHVAPDRLPPPRSTRHRLETSVGQAPHILLKPGLAPRACRTGPTAARSA